MPLNSTSFSEGTVLKSVPVIITVAPSEPVEGENPVIIGVPNTVKLDALVTVTPLVVTDIGPVVAPAGTLVVSRVGLEAVTTARVPLNRTTLLAG